MTLLDPGGASQASDVPIERAPAQTAEDAAHTLRFAIAAHVSAREAREVRVKLKRTVEGYAFEVRSRRAVDGRVGWELHAQADRLCSLGHASHVEEIEIKAEVTEAWHEGGRDYVTAYIGGSMLDYTVDEMTRAVVAGSKTVPRAVDAFLTFTRFAGLNPWMLSASQTT